ncbi:MAG: class I SAM-dependent methyltransferase, partial [candidate division WOR-3 bacterium]
MTKLSISSYNKPYSNIARYYDTLMKEVGYGKWIDYILDTIDLFNIKATPMLDVTCGTGNSLIPFVKKKKKPLLGVDNSLEMLKVAKEKEPALALVQANAMKLPFLNHFNLALSMFDSLNYILEPESLMEAFSSIKDSLKPGGHFLFDLNTPYGLKCVSGRDVREENKNLMSVWRNSYNKKDRILTLHLTLFVKKDSNWHRIDEIHKEKGYSEEEIRYSLKTLDFEIIEAFRCFEHSRPDRFTKRIL